MKPNYEQGGITIYHGDCREILPGLGKVDLLLTDPPYGISQPGARNFHGVGKGSRSFDFFPYDADRKGMMELWIKALTSSMPLLNPHASVYAWCSHRQVGGTVETLENNGFDTRMLGWLKQCPALPPPGGGWPSGFEICIYGYRPGRTWTHDGVNYPPTNIFKSDGLRHGNPEKLGHPTQKPIQVIAPLILASSLPGQIILDPFMGSGTTLRSAKDCGRNAIGIELEEEWCEMAAKRMQQSVLFTSCEVSQIPPVHN